ncbi:2-hydroxyacid dehydrogenase [Zhouia sp. PK063]|uniref:2-hydroxyacid dehydrogenase n=1 Tax=Zhouia sp. PK063 TaxID=3373602 RepID=UPI0037BB39C1
MLPLTERTPQQTNGKNIFINRKLPEEGIQKLLDFGFTVRIWEGATVISNELLHEQLQWCNAFLSCGGIELTAEILKENKHLTIISQAAAGYNNIAIETAREFGIIVANAPGTMSRATANIGFMLMLAASRKLFYMHKKIEKGEWNNFQLTDYLGQELYGKTLGVFGLGIIGYEMARLCHAAFGMKILYHNRSKNEKAEANLDAQYVSFDDLLKESDVVSVNSGLTKETKGIFNAEAFAKMKPTAIFVNVGRGGIHDEADLITALEQKIIWGAALDVTNPEPMAADNRLLHMQNVAVAPHIGSATIEARAAMATTAAQNIISFYKGDEVVNRVN